MADVVVETITSESMDYTYFDLVADISSLDTEGFIIDPRKEVMGVKNRQI